MFWTVPENARAWHAMRKIPANIIGMTHMSLCSDHTMRLSPDQRAATVALDNDQVSGKRLCMRCKRKAGLG